MAAHWNDLLEQFDPVGTAFQTEFILTLLNLVEPLAPGERLRCYQTVWWIGHELLGDDVRRVNLMRDAARVTRTFDSLGKNQAGIEHFEDLLETSEILMRTLVTLDDGQRELAIDKFWQIMLERFAYVRKNYPDSIGDGHMGR